ncbi:hypothetical protein JCM33374_g3046 [Metschnikowia sp. JCM 33374]|nr:hypothetical protein JCM33374_g3046 [Metschnikowia sp. JCM 33374]
MAKSTVLAINGSYIAYAHAIFAYSAFLTALAVGCWLHYYKIVENSSYGYPDEWFPSVSATIGDRYPERSFFQVLIACTSGPRFILIFINFLLSLESSRPFTSYVLLFSGILRTFTCGGWVYVTSTDDHDWHDISMISYIALTIPWTIAVTVLSPKKSTVRTGRALTAMAFFGTLVPLVYWFIQHKVHVRPGAYSIYAYFEWALILLDVGFDTWSVVDFKKIEITLASTGIELHQSKTVVEKTDTKNEATKVSILDDFTFPEFIVNTVNSFMFWSVLTSLLVCVWYFPLWHMGISGYEAVVTVMFLAPLLTAIPPFGTIFKSYPQIAKGLTVLLGLGSFKYEVPEQRLALITAGTGFGIISFASDLESFTYSPKKYTSLWISLLIGLMGTSVAKFSSFSNNPAWPIMNSSNGGYNEYFIAVGLISALLARAPKPESSKIERKGGSLLLASLGLGAFLFCLQAYLSDSSTLIYWNWEGYPVRGPTPLTGALFHFAAFAGGIIASIKLHPNAFHSPLYALSSFGFAYVLYAYNGWIGFAGSLGLCFYIASLGPLIGQAVAGYNIAALFFCSFLVNILISLASIWIVAYAFVPGGPLLRERTDLVLSSSVGLLAFGVVNYGLRKRDSNITRLEVRGSQILSQTIKVLTLLLAFSGAFLVRRYPTTPHTPYNSKTKSFTAGIWCVHFGLDNDMWSSETRMRDLLLEAEVDIVGLLETDTERLIGGNRDFTQKIAHDLGMYVDYGPGPNKHTWGAALLSKFPIISSSHHLLPSPVGELAPAILATLDIYGELVDVVVFHSGQEEDVEDRRLQSLGVEEIMGNSTRPLVLLSYLVTEPLTGNYNTYVSAKSRVHDIDSTDWDRWCEYILFRELKKVAYARISRSTITDTELQVAKFKFLTEEQKQQGDEFIYGNHFIDENDVDPELRMPELFKGDGVRGHRYHVFDSPRYFAETAEQT